MRMRRASGAPPLELRWNDGNGTRGALPVALAHASRPLSAALTDLRALLGDDRVRLVRGS